MTGETACRFKNDAGLQSFAYPGLHCMGAGIQGDERLITLYQENLIQGLS
jgi:hypothetical protein